MTVAEDFNFETTVKNALRDAFEECSYVNVLKGIGLAISFTGKTYASYP
jgi:hypothetical protein